MSETLLGPGEGSTPPAETPPVATPPAETPPVATPPAAETPPPAETPPVADAWMGKFEGEDLGWLQNRGLIGKSSEEALSNLVKAQRNAEIRLGVPVDRLIQLPADPTSEGAMDSVWNALGRPEDSTGYEVDAGDTELTAAFAKDISATFHEAGLTKDQGKAVETALEKFFGDQHSTQEEHTTTQRAASMAALQEEWGDTFDINVALAKEAAVVAGATEKQVNALVDAFGENGDVEVIKFFNALGHRRGIESSFIDGDNKLLGLGATTPEAARQRMQEMKADPVASRFIIANNPDNATVKQYRALAALAAKAA